MQILIDVSGVTEVRVVHRDGRHETLKLNYPEGPDVSMDVPKVPMRTKKSRNTLFFEYKGQRWPLAELVRSEHNIHKLAYATIRDRLIKHNWGVAKALNLPLHARA